MGWYCSALPAPVPPSYCLGWGEEESWHWVCKRGLTGKVKCGQGTVRRGWRFRQERAGMGKHEGCEEQRRGWIKKSGLGLIVRIQCMLGRRDRWSILKLQSRKAGVLHRERGSAQAVVGQGRGC